MQMLSILLSLGSAGIVVTYLSSGGDREMLNVAALFGFLVAVYQIIALIIGYKVLMPKNETNEMSEESIGRLDIPTFSALKAADTNEFIRPESVVEDTTELLVPIISPRNRSDGD